ncbi:hypothetical protein IFR05_010483 [Cadophora sp. M221]|nr:hypothetical protein IFR05_010483 [Cadophora sp. M221]
MPTSPESTFQSNPNPMPLSIMQVKNPVRKCKACIAGAAQDLKDMAHKIGMFHRDCDLQQLRRDALYPSQKNNWNHPYETPSGVSTDQESIQVRPSTSSSEHEGQDGNVRMRSRGRTAPSCKSAWDVMSTIQHRPMPIPNPDTPDLPNLTSKLHRRYSVDAKPKQGSRNIPSRTAQIKTTCVPQLDWTTADCRDWICVYLQEMAGYSKTCAFGKACMSPEIGEGLYHVSLWHWKNRVGCETGQSIFYHLQQCRQRGLVRFLDPSEFRRANSIPERFVWPDEDDLMSQTNLCWSNFAQYGSLPGSTDSAVGEE